MKILLSIVFVLLGVAFIFVGIKLLQSHSKITAFHKKVEEEYRPQISDLNDTIDDAYGRIQSFNQVISMTDRVFSKLLDIFFKGRKRRPRFERS